ncbi:MAG: hypothetical protein IIB90_10060 [Gemmatimonadetes bacterium]|nr:hypothetical protein [Gemmatimonadota bacterium]
MSDHQIQPWAGGASGMLAIQVASVLGVRRAVLCGIPMDTTPHFPESVIHKSTDKWMAVAGHWRAWVRHLDKIKGWVRSMSGRTMEVLGGRPTAEWLAEEDPTMVALMLTHPEAALKALAGEYKRREADFEVNFWNSRFGR